MGECAYFLKAQFPSKKTATNVATKLNAFFKEASEAYDFYQNGREGNPKEFWKKFESQYPLAYDYVKTLPNFSTKASPMILSGSIDFGQDENEVRQVDDTLGWVAEVWHMANWGPIATYIEKKFGAIKVVIDTEENGCGSLDSLQLYDYEVIVNSLLKHKELYPLLLGVHDDLNVMIDIKTKGKKS
jgi:hypothetical protein